MVLDLTIRRDTDDAKSLDDLMCVLWERYGKSGLGVPEQGIEALAENDSASSGVPGKAWAV